MRGLFVLFYSFFTAATIATASSTQVYQSVAFQSFNSTVRYVNQPVTGLQGSNVTYQYPNPMPPTDPAHDDKQKFGMRCDGKNCQAILAVNITWTNTNNQSKSCTMQVTLGVDNSGSKTHVGLATGDCVYVKKTTDGTEVWNVQPKAIRTVTVMFTGYFNPLDAAIWSNQIYANLDSTFKSLTAGQVGSYNVSSNGTTLTLSIPTAAQ